MKRAGLKRLHKTLIILFALCGVGSLVSLYFNGKASVTALLDAGWGGYVNAPENSKLAFTLSCLTNGECRPILWERFTAQELFTLIWALFIGFLVFMLAAIVVSWFANTGPDEKDPGGGHFATDEDLKAYLKDSRDPNNQRKGHYGFTESGKQLRAPSQDRCTHLAIFAGTGGGKTTRIIKPSLIQDSLDGTSVLMVDPKWPDPRGGYSDLLAVFAAKGYDVQVFCPFEENTLSLPLIGSLQSQADAEALATTIIPKVGAGETSEGAQFYRNQERELLKHLLWGEAQAGRGSMGGLYDLLDGGPKELTAWVAACDDPKITRSMGTLLQLRHDTIIGLLQGLKGTLSIFTNEQLDAATQARKHEWQNLRPASLTERKSVLYVGIPQQMFLRGDGKLLLNLFFRRIMDEVMGLARAQGGTLKRQLAVYIDEFANIGRLDDAGSWFGTMRSYNIAFTIALQNRAQLELIYGTVGAKAMSGGNFQHLITFPASLTGDDKEYISKLLGEVTAEEVAESESQQHMFEPFRRTKTRRRVARPLLSREEMNHWDANYGILVPHGAGPTKIVAPRIDQKRVGRVRNHFHAYRKTVGTGDSTVLVQGLLNRHRLMTRTQMPRRSEEPQRPKTDVPSDFEFTESYDFYGEGVEASKASATAGKAPKLQPAPAQVVKVDEPARTAPPETTIPSKTKKPSKIKPTTKKVPVKAEPLHHVPSGELMPSFRTWVDSLNWRKVPLTVFRVREGGQDRVSKILFERLPGALRHEHLAHWKQRNWVRVHGGKLGIVNTGCVVLCPKQIDAFMASPLAQVVEIGEGSERVVVKPRAETAAPASTNTTTHKPGVTRANSVEELPYLELEPEQQGVFMDWFGKNRYRFHGDFYCQNAPDGGRSTVAGTYEEGIYTLSEAVVKECLGEVPKGLQNYYRNSGVGSQRMLDLPFSLAYKLLPLRRWLDAHAADIVGHPQGKPNGTRDVARDASYTPTLIGINKDNVKEVLPEVDLPRLKVYRPDIAKARPRLIKISVPDPSTLTASSS